MYAYNVSEQVLREVAESIGVGINFGNPKGNALSFTLRWLPREDPEDDTYRKKSISWSGERRTRSVCFHGHFDFIYEVFQRVPDARITSGRYGKMDYRGMESFIEQAIELAQVNIGSQIMPVSMIESCDCGPIGYGIKHDVPSEVRR